MLKPDFKEKAINLRRQGLSYSEILREVPVAKSTLSLWLRSVNLSNPQKQRLTEKKLAGMQRGWIAKRNQRIDLTKKIKLNAKNEIKNISKKELWLVGIALYWAEGNKEKPHNISQGVAFSNSDPMMIRVFMKWLRKILKIPEDDIKYELYIHENSKNKTIDSIQYWSEITGTSQNKFKYVYLKRNKINTKRKNTNENYYGLLRIRINKSTNLNRKISGWIEGVLENCGVV